MVYDFHISVHSFPENATRGDDVSLRGQAFTPLAATSQGFPTVLPVTFETAGQRLGALPRMFFEPDGSFVWVDPTGEGRWQVDGELYDGGTTLAYAEFRGTCPADAFDRLLTAFGWPETALMFQLMREAVYLNETSFRRYAQAGTGV